MNQVKNLEFEYIVATDLAAEEILKGSVTLSMMQFRKICLSLSTELVGQDEMGCQALPLPYVSQVMIQIFARMKFSSFLR